MKKYLTVKGRINGVRDVHVKGIQKERYDSAQYKYHKAKLEAYDTSIEIVEEFENDRDFFRGSLKVATVLGFLYIVGYLLSIGWGA